MPHFGRRVSRWSLAVWAGVGMLLAAAVMVTLGRGSMVAAAQTDVRAVYVAGNLPVNDPAAPAWDDAVEAEVPISGQNVTMPFNLEPSVPAIRVRALHNAEWLAVRLQWDDATKDVGGALTRFRDSVAVQFPVTGSEPFVCMGFADAEVNILHWRSDLQRDMEDGPLRITDVFPNAFANIYPHGSDPAFSPARAAGNPLAQGAPVSAVEDLRATGFGTLKSQEHVDATGWGTWDGDSWSVVIARPLSTSDANDAQFSPGDAGSMAVAVWNGARGDVDGKKSVSAWIRMELDRLPGGAAPAAPGEPVTIAPTVVESAGSVDNLIWAVAIFLAFSAFAIIIVSAVALRRRST